MKVALCLSGLPRFWKKAYDNYIKPNLIDVLNPDVFIHSWYDPNNIEDMSLASICHVYQPKNYLIQPDKQIVMPKTEFEYNTTPRYPAYNIFSFYRSLFLADKLRSWYENDKGFVYDWVIRMRFDYALNINMKFIENCDPWKLYVPNCRQNLEHTIAVDQFAFSNTVNMTRYSGVSHHLDYYFNTGTPMVGEHMLERHLAAVGLIGDNLAYIDMQHPFGPETGDAMRHSLIRN